MRGIGLMSNLMLVADNIVDVLGQVSGIGASLGLTLQIGYDLAVHVGEGGSRAHSGSMRLERATFPGAEGFALAALRTEVLVDTRLVRRACASLMRRVATGIGDEFRRHDLSETGVGGRG